MAKSKAKEEIKVPQEEQKTPNPVGFSARPPQHKDFKQFDTVSLPIIAYFDVIKSLEIINQQMVALKQQLFENDTLRWHFEEDLVDAKDEQGNVINGTDGKPLKVLRPDFWN